MGVTLILAKRAKCQGCKALCVGKKDYTCKLGFTMEFGMVNETPVQPKPTEKCYKPANVGEYTKAKQLRGKA